MKLNHITISVKDMEESIKFYRDVIGLTVKSRFSPSAGVKIAFLGDSGSDVELIYRQSQTGITIGEDISLGFEVQSMGEIMDVLRQKGFSASEIYQPVPQIKYFFTADPNGVRIQFFENVK